MARRGVGERRVKARREKSQKENTLNDIEHAVCELVEVSTLFTAVKKKKINQTLTFLS